MLIKKYIESLVSLYGIVHKDKIIEIYNSYNDDSINVEDLKPYMKKRKWFSKRNYHIYNDYFLDKPFNNEEEFQKDLAIRKLFKYYIPSKEELLTKGSVKWMEECSELGRLGNYLNEVVSGIKGTQIG